MSAISRATIRQTIRDRGDYSNTKKFSPAYLNAEIQTAFNRFWGIVDEAHQGWWDTEDTIVTVAGAVYAALPTGAKAVKAIDRLDGTDYIPLNQVSLSERNRYGVTRGNPVAYRLSARGAELYPTPDAVYTLRVMYTPRPPTLDESTTREWYDGWEDYIIEKVLLELATRERMPIQDNLIKLEAAEKVLRASTNARRQQEPEYLDLRERGDDDLYTDWIRR
jgi:hypothetical protein